MNETLIQIKVTKEFKEKLLEEAKKLNISLSAYIRMKLS